jgi:hypothetical protein
LHQFPFVKKILKALYVLCKKLLFGKVSHKMLVKLKPGADFSYILQPTFRREDPKEQKDTDDLTVFLRFLDLRT